MQPTEHDVVARDWLPRVEALLAAPFPAVEMIEAHGLRGGPGFRLAVLRESEDFWDSRDEEIVEAALAADAAALGEALEGR